MSNSQPVVVSAPSLSAHALHGQMAKGHKSAAGLAASSKNATKHGLSSKTFILLPTEKRELFLDHKFELQQALQPRDAYEFELVSQMAEAVWLINRSKELERTALRLEMQRQRQTLQENSEPYDEPVLAWLATEALTLRNPAFSNLARYRAQHERTLFRAQRALESHRKSSGFIPRPTPLAGSGEPCELPSASAEPVHSQFLEPDPTLRPDKTKPAPALLPPTLPTAPAPPAAPLPSGTADSPTSFADPGCSTGPV